MSGFSTLWSYLRTPNKFHSRRQIEKVQRKGLVKHLKFVRSNSRFYRKHWEGVSDSDWKKFPIIDKEIMMNNLQDLLTVELDVERAKEIALNAEQTRDFSSEIDGLTIGFSSGTSGARGMHIVSKKEQGRWTGYMMRRGLGSSIFSKQKIALFLRANSNTYETVRSRRIKFEFYDLMNPLDELVNRLESYTPDVLIAPPSILRYLADKGTKIRPRRLLSSAEVLTDIDKEVIEAYFGTIVHQFYSSTEGEIGATCELGTIHLNEGIMAIQKEWIDEEKGWYHPIITDFNRTTQPIIRYRQNDILVTSKEPCPCGDARESISSVMGRQDDMFYFERANAEGLEAIIPDLIRRATLQMSHEITAYQVVQSDSDRIKVHLEPEISDANISGFELLWREKGVLPPSIEILPYSLIPSVVKMRRIHRSWKR